MAVTSPSAAPAALIASSVVSTCVPGDVLSTLVVWSACSVGLMIPSPCASPSVCPSSWRSTVCKSMCRPPSGYDTVQPQLPAVGSTVIVLPLVTASSRSGRSASVTVTPSKLALGLEAIQVAFAVANAASSCACVSAVTAPVVVGAVAAAEGSGAAAGGSSAGGADASLVVDGGGGGGSLAG